MGQTDSAAPSGLWESILSSVESKIGARARRTWLSPASIGGLNAGVLRLAVPNDFFVEWIGEHYLRFLNEAASDSLGRPVKVEIFADDRASQGGNGAGDGEAGIDTAEKNDNCYAHTGNGSGREHVTISTSPSHGHGRGLQDPRGCAALNGNYTFDNLVVAGSNQLAAAACRAVCERPGTAYNPLFIYGGSGLGKTHMLHAIGHAALGDASSNGVYYVSAERFMNEMIASIQQGTALAFRNKYRRARLLLIDDVHFLGGKEGTQEEFFHTFNSLHEAGRQIVLTSDRPPKEIPRVEDRLISRFTWGLVADIQRPDLEMRIAILHQKAVRQGIKLSSDVALAIARMARSNIRELEGSLLRLKAHAQLTGQPLTAEMVGDFLGEILRPQRALPTVNDVQRAVARHFALRPQDLCGRKRTNAVALPRQLAMYLCRAQLDIPLAEVGEQFGGRDHTTVLYACSKVESKLRTDPALRRTLNTISGALFGAGENVFAN